MSLATTSNLISDIVVDPREELAHEHDRRAREIDRQYKTVWIELADICICVRDNREYEILGFHSFHAWLLDACPSSRSMAYLAMGVREELRDIHTEDLKEMPLGNARILKAMPKAARQKPTLIEHAKVTKPKQFIAAAVEAAPDSHLEETITKRYSFVKSRLLIIEQAIELKAMLDEEGYSDEEALEAICVEWMLSKQSEYQSRKFQGSAARFV